MFFHVYFVTYNLWDAAISCKRKSLIKSPILVSLLSEEHAILEGVLSCRSGGPESCTGAGLPLEGNSRQHQNENNNENPSWTLECSYTAWFRVSIVLQTFGRRHLYFTSTWAENVAGMLEELQGFDVWKEEHNDT